VAKDYNYKVLIARMREAISDEFYLEASWIAYAILEDRLVSALDETGGAKKANGAPIMMMGPKVGVLRSTMPSNLHLRAAFLDGKLFDELDSWKDQRNTLMHAMADETLDIPAIDELALEVATEGDRLATEFCAACRRLKNYNRRRR